VVFKKNAAATCTVQHGRRQVTTVSFITDCSVASSVSDSVSQQEILKNSFCFSQAIAQSQNNNQSVHRLRSAKKPISARGNVTTTHSADKQMQLHLTNLNAAVKPYITKRFA
jgi:hypothetical protein